MSFRDAVRVRQAARAVGLYVAAASALIVAGGVGILVAVILSTSRVEGDDGREPSEHGGGLGRPRGDDFVVDVDRILPVVVVLGILGVLLLTLVAWFAARRSVRPLAETLRRQRDFVADASHELRTPLTALSSRIQVLERRRDRGDPLDETIQALRQDAALMTDVLTDLLLAAEPGSEGIRGSADALLCAERAAASLHLLAEEADVRLVVIGPVEQTDHGAEAAVGSGAAAAISPTTLTRVLVALIDNAIQHSPPGATVTISVAAAGPRGVELRVADEGEGIQGIDATRVFDRFARSAETGRRRGFGLGLSLVHDVAVRAGGSVRVERTSPDGTTFLLTLPRAR